MKALSLAMLLTRNPKQSDKASRLKEIFMTLKQEEESEFKVRRDPGFHFLNTLSSRENEFHQDCVCQLSFMLGQTEKAISNYDIKLTFWNMVLNPALQNNNPDNKPKKSRARKVALNMSDDDMVENEFKEQKANSFEEVLKDDIGLND